MRNKGTSMVSKPGPGRMDECLFVLEPLHLLLSMLEINRVGLDFVCQLCGTSAVCSHCQKRRNNHGQVACDDTCFSILSSGCSL